MFKIILLPIIVLELLGSYGIGAYAKTHHSAWIAVTFVSFGLTGASLCYLASKGSALSWLILIIFGCVTPVAGYVVGMYCFGEKFVPLNLIALACIAIAIVLLAIPRT